MPATAAQPAFLSARQVAERYGISDTTLDSWLCDDALQFPQPMVIRGHRYFQEERLQAWEAARSTPGEPTVPAMSPVIRDYRALVDALILARQARGLSCAEVEYRSGLQDGYTTKLEHFDKPYGRNLGPVSLPLLLEGLNCGLVLVDLSAAHS